MAGRVNLVRGRERNEKREGWWKACPFHRLVDGMGMERDDDAGLFASCSIGFHGKSRTFGRWALVLKEQISCSRSVIGVTRVPDLNHTGKQDGRILEHSRA